MSCEDCDSLVAMIAEAGAYNLEESEQMVGNYYEVLDMFAEALCFILEFAPGGEFSFDYPAQTCNLKFTVSKN